MTANEITIALYQSITQAHEERHRERWHVSDLAKCPRAQFMARKQAPPVQRPTAAKMLRWQAGHHIETTIRPHLRSIYPTLITNQRYESEAWDLTGEFDGYDPNSKTLVSVKSVSVHAVRYKRKDETEYHLRDNGPYLGHEYQEHGYILLLQEHGLTVEHIHYQYITLDGLLITYITSVNPRILEDVGHRLQILTEAWHKNIPPPCICYADHPLWPSAMQYCDYRNGTECCVYTPKKKKGVSNGKEI